MNLSDGVLIKDNHIAALRSTGNTLEQLIKQARSTAPHTLKIEVEVESVEGAISAASAGADIVMLDNMHPDDMRSAVPLHRKACTVFSNKLCATSLWAASIKLGRLPLRVDA